MTWTDCWDHKSLLLVLMKIRIRMWQREFFMWISLDDNSRCCTNIRIFRNLLRNLMNKNNRGTIRDGSLTQLSSVFLKSKLIQVKALPYSEEIKQVSAKFFWMMIPDKLQFSQIYGNRIFSNEAYYLNNNELFRGKVVV